MNSELHAFEVKWLNSRRKTLKSTHTCEDRKLQDCAEAGVKAHNFKVPPNPSAPKEISDFSCL
jgi:hypothetical protein